jgi:hypothetical protein
MATPKIPDSSRDARYEARAASEAGASEVVISADNGKAESKQRDLSNGGDDASLTIDTAKESASAESRGDAVESEVTASTTDKSCKSSDGSITSTETCGV